MAGGSHRRHRTALVASADLPRAYEPIHEQPCCISRTGLTIAHGDGLMSTLPTTRCTMARSFRIAIIVIAITAAATAALAALAPELPPPILQAYLRIGKRSLTVLPIPCQSMSQR